MGSILILMIVLPLIGSILNGLIIRTPHPRLAGVIATLFSAGSFAIAVSLWTGLVSVKLPIAISFPWFNAGTTHIQWGFSFDALTAMMCLVVTGIGTLIHLYSIGYMSEERTPSRYFAYLNLFLFNMLTLVCGDNLVVMFVGWEGVGLCSYLLIGYWYQDIEKANAGMKAFIVNRIGDAGFLLGIFFCFQVFGSVNFGTIAEFMAKSGATADPRLLELIAVLLFVGAMGKSAQIPLYVWLPDAMAGPTPVSALIHAATMVTAGVYLIARTNFLYHVTPEASLFVAIIGAATALFAATIAIAQKDIKKVLAYSTVSQLGLMFLALGTGNYFAAVFHLMTHAFFKALMFLGAGSVIHACHHEQDIFHMGGLRKKMPITFWTFTAGWLAISGIPPLAGFFSKDLILYGALFAPKYGTELWLAGSVASVLTSFYMTRLYALTFFGEYRGHADPHENTAVMWIPLAVLAVGSAAAGFLGLPESMGNNVLGHFLSTVIPEVAEGHAWLTEGAAMGIATTGAVLSIALGLFLYGKGPERTAGLATALNPVRSLLENKYWIDELYGFVIIKPFEYVSLFFSRIIDVKVIDAAVLFPTRVARAGATFLSLIQGGAAQFYLLVMLLGAVALMWFTLKGTVI